MGIPGLTGFMDDYFEHWKTVTLRDATSHCGGKLIVDGYGLCWRVAVDCSYGGQYLQFKESVKNMFLLLKQEGIAPIVVMDGAGHMTEKLAVKLQRRKERIGPIRRLREPVLQALSREVFVATVTDPDFGVQLCVADGDADEAIAKLANHYSCPVLAADSDYFIFNLQAGYIPLDTLDFDSRPMKAKLYCINSFAGQFNFRQTSLCYAIPAIFGNDFGKPLSGGNLRRICLSDIEGKAKERIQKVCTHLGEFYHSLEECMATGDEVREACLKTQELYSIRETFDFEYLMEPEKSLIRHHSGDKLPNWFITAYRKGYIPSYIVDATICQSTILPNVIDDVDKKTSTSLSNQIRQGLYALLGCDKVTEYVRDGHKILPRDLQCRKEINRMNIPHLFVTTEEVDAESILFAILGCPINTFKASLGRHYDRWILMSAVTLYWAKCAGASHKLVKSLIACFLLCYTGSQSAMKCYTGALSHPEHYKNAIHSFTQWQYAYHCALALKAVLRCRPVIAFPPEKIYDDKCALYLACEERHLESRVEQIIPKKYNKLFQKLTETIFAELQPTTPPPPSPVLSTTNKFELLQYLEQ